MIQNQTGYKSQVTEKACSVALWYWVTGITLEQMPIFQSFHNVIRTFKIQCIRIALTTSGTTAFLIYVSYFIWLQLNHCRQDSIFVVFFLLWFIQWGVFHWFIKVWLVELRALGKLTSPFIGVAPLTSIPLLIIRIKAANQQA